MSAKQPFPMVSGTIVLRALVGLVVLIALLHVGLRSQLVRDYRVDVGGAELNVIYGVQKVLLGRPLYQNPERTPFEVMQYTPAYYWLCAGAAKALGIDPFDTLGLFRLGRSISLLFNLLSCLLVYRIGRSFHKDAWLAAGVAAVAFGLFTEHFYDRADSLYALLFLATVLYYLRALQDPVPNPKRMWTLAALCVGCALAKQTGIALSGIIGFHLITLHAWRPLIRLLLALLVLAALCLLLMLGDASLHVLWQNMVRGVMNGYGHSLFAELFSHGTYKYYVGWHLAGVALIIAFFRSRDAVDRFLAIAILSMLAVGLLGGMKSGSNINYLWEGHVLILLGCVKWLASQPTGLRAHPYLLVLYGAVFLFHRTQLLRTRVGTTEDRDRSEVAYRADLRVRDVLVNDMGLRKGENVLITYRGHLELLLNGQGLLPQKDILEWSVVYPFDLADFDHAMNDGNVRFVIADRPIDDLHFAGRTLPQFVREREVDGRSILVRSAP